MLMDRSWMQLDRTNPSFAKGVDEFIKFAYLRKEPNKKIPCPCYQCNNFCDQTQEVVRYHLSINGIKRSYIRWVYHGESYENDFDDGRSIEENVDRGHSEDDSSVDGMFEMLNDISNACLGETSGIEETLTSPGAPFPLGRADTLLKLLEDSKEKLYEGCESYSKLSFLVKLLHRKTISGWTNKSFDMLLELLKDAFQGVHVDLPKSYYESKKMMRDLGFKYEKIHSCPNDCALFRKEYDDFENCPKCKTSRWKFEGSKRIPQKVLRYFPLKHRLERLFVNKDLARHMRWHKEERVDEENALRHPADSGVWRDFDKKHPLFANDPRNVRLGLASDGFNPFGSMSNSYSIWPVIIVPYNLPPWMCMKDPFLMLSMLIPGSKGPGNDIDIYLQPLIDELKELWETGIEAYDAYKEEKFILRASLMWTISDLPAHSYLSGWITSGYYACPVCMSETICEHLPNGKKRCYMGHRRFLPIGHKWRYEVKEFDGNKEHRSAPILLSGEEIFQQLSTIKHAEFGKELNSTDTKKKGHKRKRGRRRKQLTNKSNWRKQSIFFDLPYWKTLKMRHNLDVMHIEKNVCDNILGTLMNIAGKTKDNKRARRDLMEKGLKPNLHLQGESEDMPLAFYTFIR